MNVRETIVSQPMSRFQIGVLITCLLVCMIDGFEILVMGFVVPAMGKAWHLSPVQVGYVLAAGIFGMAMGSTFLSPPADKFGRRKHVLLCMLLIIVGMVVSAAAPNLALLLIARAFAGLFIGAIMASLNVTVAEYSSDRRRGTVMGIYGIGFPLGGSLGGFVSVFLIGTYGWRAPLWFSAGLTFILFLVALAVLPESINFLVEKRPANALKTYNKIGAKLGLAPASELPPQTRYEVKATVGQSMFRGVMLERTIYCGSATRSSLLHSTSPTRGRLNCSRRRPATRCLGSVSAPSSRPAASSAPSASPCCLCAFTHASSP